MIRVVSALPPSTEQSEIVSFLDDETAKIDRLRGVGAASDRPSSRAPLRPTRRRRRPGRRPRRRERRRRMNTHPQATQILLPSGDPQGIRVASITTRIVHLIEVPRSLLGEFLKMPESGQVGLYVLLGERDGDNQRQVYIGQTGVPTDRLVTHHQKNEFWNRALVAISLTNNLTGTTRVVWSGCRFRKPPRRGTTRWRRATRAAARTRSRHCRPSAWSVGTLLATPGQPAFEPLVSPSPQRHPPPVHLSRLGRRRPGLQHRGRLGGAEGFVWPHPPRARSSVLVAQRGGGLVDRTDRTRAGQVEGRPGTHAGRRPECDNGRADVAGRAAMPRVRWWCVGRLPFRP